MSKYNKEQKYIRYKYSYYTLCLFSILLISNILLRILFKLHWAENETDEIIIIYMFSMTFFGITTSFNNAYLNKNKNPIFYIAIFIISSVLNITLAFTNKVINPIYPLTVAISSFLISMTIFVRFMINLKKK